MSFFNLGKKDKHVKQKRIEHRSDNLRISRTGGVALRKQAKVAGLTVTANTKHGLRVSSRVAQNTQVALQNGRLVLRGRYGRGPTKLNLSKSSISVSTRNPIGTFNWIKPNRSSVKIAGVQLRGKKAANIQLIYMLFTSITLGLQMCWQLLLIVSRGAGLIVTGLLRFVLEIPSLLSAAWQRIRHAGIASNLNRTQQLFDPSISSWTSTEQLAALFLVLSGWGRGLTAPETAVRIIQQHQGHPDSTSLLGVTEHELNVSAQRLELVRTRNASESAAKPHATIALLAQQLAKTLPAEDTVEALLCADEWVLALGERTVLQEQLIEVFADFAQLRFQAAEPCAL